MVSLAFTKSGDLIAGTESPGRVFRIDSSGKAFVLLDSPFREIHAVRLAEDGTIYAVAVNGSQGGESRPTESPAPEPARAPGLRFLNYNHRCCRRTGEQATSVSATPGGTSRRSRRTIAFAPTASGT